MPKTQFAILGFGHHASRRLVPAFARSREAELVGLWRRNPVAAANDAQTHGTRAFAGPDELCASPEVDAVLITSPDAMHLADAELAFRHGKAVLCEKPLAMNAGQAAAMQAAAERADDRPRARVNEVIGLLQARGADRRGSGTVRGEVSVHPVVPA